jgi:uroporphyrinogen decarboxylase
MNSKERVIKAVTLQRPDRTPVDLWALPPVTFQLRNHFRVEKDEEVWKALGVDLRSIWPDYIGPKHKLFPDGSWIDWWGIHKKMVGSFDEIADYPLARYNTVEEIERYSWPDPSWFDYEGLTQQCEQFEEYALVVRDPGPYTTCVLRVAMYLRSMDKFMMDLILNPEIAQAILNHVAEFYLEMSRRILETIGEFTNIYCIADDVGMQEGLLLSPNMFDRFIKPYFVQFVDLAKKYDQRVMYHSCGAIKPLIPRFVDLGIDILNPIQLSAQGMDPVELKREFGEILCFHGALDVQTVLFTGTPDKIRDEVARLCRLFGKEGGFILAPTNNIVPETPLENILAVYEAARDSR